MFTTCLVDELMRCVRHVVCVCEVCLYICLLYQACATIAVSQDTLEAIARSQFCADAIDAIKLDTNECDNRKRVRDASVCRGKRLGGSVSCICRGSLVLWVCLMPILICFACLLSSLHAANPDTMNVIVLPVATASKDLRIRWLCHLQLPRLASPCDRWLTISFECRATVSIMLCKFFLFSLRS